MLAPQGTSLAPKIKSIVRQAEKNAQPDVDLKKVVTTMTKAVHERAAEHHATAAKSQSTAAEHYGKGDKAKVAERVGSSISDWFSLIERSSRTGELPKAS